MLIEIIKYVYIIVFIFAFRIFFIGIPIAARNDGTGIRYGWKIQFFAVIVTSMIWPLWFILYPKIFVVSLFSNEKEIKEAFGEK